MVASQVTTLLLSVPDSMPAINLRVPLGAIEAGDGLVSSDIGARLVLLEVDGRGHPHLPQLCPVTE